MLDTLLEAELGQQIDEEGIQEEVDTFIIAGFESTMTTISFALSLLALHPDAQQKLCDEICDFYGMKRSSIWKQYSYPLDIYYFIFVTKISMEIR